MSHPGGFTRTQVAREGDAGVQAWQIRNPPRQVLCTGLGGGFVGPIQGFYNGRILQGILLVKLSHIATAAPTNMGA